LRSYPGRSHGRVNQRVVMKLIQDRINRTQITPISLFLNLRNQKCKIYDDKVITCETLRRLMIVIKHLELLALSKYQYEEVLTIKPCGAGDAGAYSAGAYKRAFTRLLLLKFNNGN